MTKETRYRVLQNIIRDLNGISEAECYALSDNDIYKLNTLSKDLEQKADNYALLEQLKTVLERVVLGIEGDYPIDEVLDMFTERALSGEK